jgi:hypothetical protein
MFKEGQHVIWVDTDDKMVPRINHGTVKQVLNRDEVVLVGHKYPHLAAFMYPETVECIGFLQQGIDLTLRHKAEADKRFTEVLQFNNELVRKGLK